MLVICAVSSLPARTFAKTVETDEPLVKVTPPAGYKAQKILTFPLKIPSYIIRGVFWPVGVGLTYLERKHVVEKTLDLLSNKDKTFWVYPIIEGGAGSGFGGGIGVSDTDLFHKGFETGATYRIHINMDQHATFSFGKPHAVKIGDVPLSFMFASDWQRTTNNDFYGIGNGSPRSNQSEFGSDRVSLGLILPFSILETFTVSPYIGAVLDDTGAAENTPQVTATFAPAEIPGYGRWLDYLNFGLGITNDTTDKPIDPENGGIRKLGIKRFQCLNAAGFNYNQYDLDVRQYIKLWAPGHVFLARAAFAFEQVTGGGTVPFWQLTTLDYASPLRGFPRGRFMDRDYGLANFEYRFPIVDMLRGVIFLDVGRVFHSPKDITVKNIKYSAGGGVHFNIHNFGRFRFEAAYGGEGVNIMFGTSRPL